MSVTRSAGHDGRQARWQGEPSGRVRVSPVLVLDESGLVMACNASCEGLFGYRRRDLVGHHISALYPQLSGVSLFSDGKFNPMLDFLAHCGYAFHARGRWGAAVASDLRFVRTERKGRRSLRLVVRPLEHGLPGRGQAHGEALRLAGGEGSTCGDSCADGAA